MNAAKMFAVAMVLVTTGALMIQRDARERLDAQEWAIEAAAGQAGEAPALASQASAALATCGRLQVARQAVVLGAVMNDAQEPGAGFRALLRERPEEGLSYPLVGVGAAAGLAFLRPKRRRATASPADVSAERATPPPAETSAEGGVHSEGTTPSE